MISIIISAIVFAVGLLFLSGLLPGMQVRGFGGALKAAVVCGLLSAVLGKVLMVLLTLVLWIPIVLTGALGVFLVQGLVNAVLLWLTAKLVSSLDFDRRRTLLWAAFALTLGQTVAGWLH